MIKIDSVQQAICVATSCAQTATKTVSVSTRTSFLPLHLYLCGTHATMLRVAIEEGTVK